MKAITASLIQELDIEENMLFSYIDRFKKQLVDEHKQPDAYMITNIHKNPDDTLSIQYQPKPVTRIRRITGYLVSDIERWNDGKYAELMDRVCHNTI